jgi:hypothetical protein
VSATSPRVLVIQHEASTGPGWFGRWLVEAGLELDVRHPYADDELPAPDTLETLETLERFGIVARGPKHVI